MQFGIIGVLINGLIGAIAISLPTLIKRLAISLGVGVAVFTGADFLLDGVKSNILSTIFSLPPEAIQMIGVLNIDKAINIILSAVTIKFTFKSMGGTEPKQVGLL